MTAQQTYENMVDALGKAFIKGFDTPQGQKHVHALRERIMRDNPNFTPEQWEETKRELVGVAVLMAIRENKDCFEIFYQAVKEGYEQQQ